MGFKLAKLGKHLFGSVDQLVQGFANSLHHAAEAPRTPALLGAVTLCAGVFVVKQFKTRRDKKNQTRSPSRTEGSLSTRSTTSASTSISAITSPRSPRFEGTHAHSLAPFRLRNAVVSRPSAASSNGLLAVFAPTSPTIVPATPASFTPKLTLPTPEKSAEECLDYDELDQADEVHKLQKKYRASKALADLSNKDSDNVSLTSGTKQVLHLRLDQMTAQGVSTRQASAQLSRPHKVSGLKEIPAICQGMI
ncbi:hypothetical protein ABBQ38_012402 [Trebouxia sp. C0009 RCD-2024]